MTERVELNQDAVDALSKLEPLSERELWTLANLTTREISDVAVQRLLVTALDLRPVAR